MSAAFVEGKCRIFGPTSFFFALGFCSVRFWWANLFYLSNAFRFGFFLKVCRRNFSTPKFLRDTSLESIDFWDVKICSIQQMAPCFLGRQLHVGILDCKICDLCFMVRKCSKKHTNWIEFPHILHLFLWIFALLLSFSPWFEKIYEPQSCGWENQKVQVFVGSLCLLSSFKWKRRFSNLKLQIDQKFIFQMISVEELVYTSKYTQ